jgi:hypothetical protein
MNPLLYQFFYDQPLSKPVERNVPPPVNPATAVDRAYIQANAPQNSLEMFVYEREPVADEWPARDTTGAIVRVFVINPTTSVRVLQAPDGERLAEPMLDSWLGDYAQPSVA